MSKETLDEITQIGQEIDGAELPVAWRVEAEGATWDYARDEPSAEDIAWAARYGRTYQPLYGPEVAERLKVAEAKLREGGNSVPD